MLLTAGAVRVRRESSRLAEYPNTAQICGVHEADGSHVSLTDALARPYSWPAPWDLLSGLALTGVVALRNIDTTSNVIFDPMLVPPFDGIDLDAVDLHREVKMVAAG